MTYDPEKDLKDIRDAIVADMDILRVFELTTMTEPEEPEEGEEAEEPVEIPVSKEIINDTIIKISKYYDLAEGKKRLCIFPRPSRPGGMETTSQNIVQIDCHVPDTTPDVARKVVGMVWGLLGDEYIKGKILHWDGELGELPTAPGYYCYGMRLAYSRVVYTKHK